MENCLKCKGKLEKAIKIINYIGRTELVNVMQCAKCNNAYTHIDDAEKARLSLNPSFSK